jgi:hypothetical protein
MSGEGDRLDRLVQEASGLLASTNGKVGIMQAMRLVGFTTPERNNMKVYQRVRRGATRYAVVPVVHVRKNAKVKDPPPPAVDLTVVTNSLHGSGISTLTSSVNNNSSPDSINSVPVARRLHDGDTPQTSNEDKEPEAKKRRATSKEVQALAADKAKKKLKDKMAMKQVTVLVERNNALSKNDPNKRTMVDLVAQTNERLGSSVSVVTVGRYVREGMIGVSPMKRGPVGDFPSHWYNALKGAYITYLKLEQATSKKQSNLKHLAIKVNACVNKLGFRKTRDDLVRKLRRDTADHFSAGKANVVEQRRLMWTTSYNLNIWYTTWKETLTDLGFGRVATAADDPDLGEVIFFHGQTHRIGNIDETDGSLDDTTGQRGGRPPMTFYSPDIAGGGTAANKSG